MVRCREAQHSTGLPGCPDDKLRNAVEDGGERLPDQGCSRDVFYLRSLKDAREKTSKFRNGNHRLQNQYNVKDFDGFKEDFDLLQSKFFCLKHFQTFFNCESNT